MALDFDECCHELLVHGIDTTPSDLQGGLYGRMCGGQGFEEQDLLAFFAELIDVSSSSLTAIKDMLSKIYQSTVAQIGAEQGLVELLLPDDEEAMSERIEALACWCQSYLSGLGLSGLSGETNLAPDVAEAMRDLAAIALVDPNSEQEEDDEASFVELVEFVRVASSLIHVELAHMMSAPTKAKH